MRAEGGWRLGLRDGLRVASVGLRARRLRAALSALGIAIGTAAIVAVLGLSASSQAGLIAEIDRLGTNLLTVEAGQRLTGGEAELPLDAPARLAHLDDVELVAHTALVQDAKVYRNPLIPAGNTGGLQVQATSLNLPSVLGTDVARGSWLNDGTAREPVTVLGSAAARRLGIDRVHPDQRIWLGHQWFDVAGILAALAARARRRQQRPGRLPGRPDGTSATSAWSAASSRPVRRPRSTCAPPPATRRRCRRCSREPPTPRRRTR